MKDDTQDIWKGVQSEIQVSGEAPASGISGKIHPAVVVGLGGFFLLNVGALLSLPPVLRGKGAPYLPTFSGKLNVMFTQLRQDKHIAKKLQTKQPLRFVDLGSGDGRVVFRAAREGIFDKSIGYEINPCKRMLSCPLRCTLIVRMALTHGCLDPLQCFICLRNHDDASKPRSTGPLLNS